MSSITHSENPTVAISQNFCLFFSDSIEENLPEVDMFDTKGYQDTGIESIRIET